jgi:hypothetical protein
MRKESEVARDIFKFFDKKCKEQKIRVERAREHYEEYKRQFYFEDEICLVDSARQDYLCEEAMLYQLVKDKIAVEKYMRKLRHMEEEEEQEQSEVEL